MSSRRGQRAIEMTTKREKRKKDGIELLMLDTSELKTTTRIMLNGFNYRRQLLGRVPFVLHRIRECHFAFPLVAARNLRAITGRVTTMRPGDILIIVSLLEFSFYLMMYKGLG